MNYLLGSGYFHPKTDEDNFVGTWFQNLEKHTDRAPPKRVVIVSVGGSWGPVQKMWEECCPYPIDVVELEGNLGHVHGLLGKEPPFKPHAYCGWSASVLALAMLAYNAELDFVYRESDVLAFGDYIGEMYRQLGDGKMIFGSYKENGKHKMPCAQSLFLIKHDFIPKFVSKYLSLPNDRRVDFLPEAKFGYIEASTMGVKRFTFGVDRGRPLPFDDLVWYAQHFTCAELSELKRRGLI